MRKALKQIVTAVLRWEARLALFVYKPKIVAITGSVGKTSTKDAIHTVLSSIYRARKSDKSFNTEIGLPLTILGLPTAWGSPIGWALNIISGFFVALGFSKDYPEWLVLEVGADAPGDIKSLSSWLRTDVAVITRLPEVPVHVEFFSSPEDVIEEKLSLIDTIKHDGTLILNFDDRYVMRARERSRAYTLTFGFDIGADISASNIKTLFDKKGFPSGINIKINEGGSSMPFEIQGTLGKGHAYAYLAAATVGVSEDINLIDSAQALKEHKTPPGRMKIIEGLKDTAILDDSYNSSPTAALLALDILEELPVKGRRVAVLGDMAELGVFSEDEHKKIGAKAKNIADILVTVGRKARGFAEGALAEGMSEKNVFQYDDSRKAGKFIETLIQSGDLVLVKGSQSVRMEKTVEEIMANPEKKKELLVRQDSEWQNR